MILEMNSVSRRRDNLREGNKVAYRYPKNGVPEMLSLMKMTLTSEGDYFEVD